MPKTYEGKPLTKICKDKDQPSLSTVYKWIAKHKDFASKLLTARKIGCQTYLDKMIEELETADNKNIMVVREKLHHYRWLAFKTTAYLLRQARDYSRHEGND